MKHKFLFLVPILFIISGCSFNSKTELKYQNIEPNFNYKYFEHMVEYTRLSGTSGIVGKFYRKHTFNGNPAGKKELIINPDLTYEYLLYNEGKDIPYCTEQGTVELSYNENDGKPYGYAKFLIIDSDGSSTHERLGRYYVTDEKLYVEFVLYVIPDPLD